MIDATLLRHFSIHRANSVKLVLTLHIQTKQLNIVSTVLTIVKTAIIIRLLRELNVITVHKMPL